jgi:hypothetical protein
LCCVTSSICMIAWLTCSRPELCSTLAAQSLQDQATRLGQVVGAFKLAPSLELLRIA